MNNEISVSKLSGTAWYRRPDFYFWLIAAAGLLFRMEYLREFSAFDHFDCAVGPDVQDYHERTIGILAGELLPDVPHIHAPLYSFFLALLYKLTGNSIPWVRFIQLVLNWGAWVGFARLLKWRHAPEKVVLSFLTLAMFVPALIFHQGELISESLLAVILLPAFYLLYKGGDENASLHCFTGAGFLSGLAVLTHGFLWAFAGAETLCFLWRRQWKRAALFFCGALCAVIPVVLAKSVYYEKLTPLQNNTMFNVWLGHCENADGGCWMRSGRAWQEEHRNTAIEAESRGVSVSCIYLERIAGFYSENPGAVIKLAVKKLWKLVLPVEFISGADSPAMIGKSAVQRYFRIFAVAAGLLAVSGVMLLLLKKVPEPARYIHFYLLAAALSGAQILTVTSGRYRMGMMPGVILLAATAVSELKPRQAMVAICAVIAMTFMLPPLPESDPVERSIMGEVYYRKGKYAEAEKALAAASLTLDDPGRFCNLRGIIAENQGDFKKAEVFYLEAIAQLNADAYFNHGFMLSKNFPDRLEDANISLYGGLKLSPNRPDVLNQIGVNMVQLNLLQLARICFAAALELAPDHAGYRRNLEFVNAKLSPELRK